MLIVVTQFSPCHRKWPGKEREGVLSRVVGLDPKLLHTLRLPWPSYSSFLASLPPRE